MLTREPGGTLAGLRLDADAVVLADVLLADRLAVGAPLALGVAVAAPLVVDESRDGLGPRLDHVVGLPVDALEALADVQASMGE